MLKNKKGLSEAVMTVIMIALVLVAIGVIWVVVSNIIQKNATGIDYSERCNGLFIGAVKIDCPVVAGQPDPVTGIAPDTYPLCTVTLERTTLSKTDPIGGVELTFDKATLASDSTGDVAVTRTTDTITNPDPTQPVTKLTSKIYFIDAKTGGKHYCAISSYPKE